jgi:pentatricopeptide repeat protein
LQKKNLEMVLPSQGTTTCFRRAVLTTAAANSRRQAAAIGIVRQKFSTNSQTSIDRNFSPNDQSQQATTGTSQGSSFSSTPSSFRRGNDLTEASSAPTPPPPVDQLIQDLEKATLFNQGKPRRILSKRKARQNYYWDVDFCRSTARAYEEYLLSMANMDKSAANVSKSDRATLLSPQVVDTALRVLLKCRLKPTRLSVSVRDWERALGTLAATPLTDKLSFRLLEANGKAGNIGRVLSLLDFRTNQGYPARNAEFILAVTAVEAAGWFLREHRNVYLGDVDQPAIDNPTRWLDAILLNMSQRNFPLTIDLAARMLDTFASRGRTGKAQHYFYSVHRTPLELADYDNASDDGSSASFDDEQQSIEKESNKYSGEFSHTHAMPKFNNRPVKVRLLLKTPPPYYKVPTEVKGKLLPSPPGNSSRRGKDGKGIQKQLHEQEFNRSKDGVLKIDRESEPDWSLPLTAAFSFADSLTQGVCGHDPIELNLVCYNILIKACVYRGALWRAMNLLETVMPSAGITPDHRSYDTLLAGLARVGDVTLMRDFYQRMISRGIEPSYYTVQCIVDGLLNLGDVAGAVTVVQDFFNQHSVLPRVTTQLKILEFALGRDMVHEAKRHVYFIQQLWKWQPNYKYDSKDFVYFMKTYQRDPRISKEALQHLFAYFGEQLGDSDFF